MPLTDYGRAQVRVSSQSHCWLGCRFLHLPLAPKLAFRSSFFFSKEVTAYIIEKYWAAAFRSKLGSASQLKRPGSQKPTQVCIRACEKRAKAVRSSGPGRVVRGCKRFPVPIPMFVVRMISLACPCPCPWPVPCRVPVCVGWSRDGRRHGMHVCAARFACQSPR